MIWAKRQVGSGAARSGEHNNGVGKKKKSKNDARGRGVFCFFCVWGKDAIGNDRLRVFGPKMCLKEVFWRKKPWVRVGGATLAGATLAVPATFFLPVSGAGGTRKRFVLLGVAGGWRLLEAGWAWPERKRAGFGGKVAISTRGRVALGYVQDGIHHGAWLVVGVGGRRSGDLKTELWAATGISCFCDILLFLAFGAVSCVLSIFLSWIRTAHQSEAQERPDSAKSINAIQSGSAIHIAGKPFCGIPNPKPKRKCRIRHTNGREAGSAHVMHHLISFSLVRRISPPPQCLS